MSIDTCKILLVFLLLDFSVFFSSRQQKLLTFEFQEQGKLRNFFLCTVQYIVCVSVWLFLCTVQYMVSLSKLSSKFALLAFVLLFVTSFKMTTFELKEEGILQTCMNAKEFRKCCSSTAIVKFELQNPETAVYDWTKIFLATTDLVKYLDKGTCEFVKGVLQLPRQHFTSELEEDKDRLDAPISSFLVLLDPEYDTATNDPITKCIRNNSTTYKATTSDGMTFRFKVFIDALYTQKQEPGFNQWCSKLRDCIVTGICEGDLFSWFVNPDYVDISTARVFQTLSQLKDQVQDYKEELDKQKELIKQLESQTPTPIASTPIKHDVSFTEDLSKSLSAHTDEMIKKFSKEGFITSHVPKIQCSFSGDGLKGDVSYETWEFEVNLMLDSKTAHQQIKQAITKSLKGGALDALRSLGNLASVSIDTILQKLRSKYGISASYDTLMQNFYVQNQKEDEDIAHFSTRIEGVLRDIVLTFPDKLRKEEQDTKLKERLFHGSVDSVRNAMMFLYKCKTTSYTELLAMAREVEAGNRVRASDPTKDSDKKDKKTHVKSVTTGNVDLESLLHENLNSSKPVSEIVQNLQQALQGLLQQNKSSNGSNSTFKKNGEGNVQNKKGSSIGFSKPPKTDNPNPRYLGHRFDANFQSKRNQGNGNRQVGTQPKKFDQSQNLQQLQGNDSNSSNDNGLQNRRREPFCKFCKHAGLPQTNHSPNYCLYLQSLSESNTGRQMNNAGNQNQNSAQLRSNGPVVTQPQTPESTSNSTPPLN